MSLTNRSTVRRLVAALAAVAVVAGMALATPAGAVGDTGTRRIQGPDRYVTAAQVALDTFPDGAATVVLATGQEFADALSASGLAGALGAPVLLSLTDSVPQATVDALAALETTDIVLMGGEAAISTSVEEALADEFDSVTRVEGPDRFATAAEAATAIAGTDDGNPLTEDDGLGSTSEGVTALLTSGLAFPDAVSASPVAYANRLPILLATPEVLPQSTIDAITDNGIEHVVIVGGEGVISATVRQQIEDETEVTTARIAGLDRWQTNTELAQFGMDEAALDPSTAYVATGLAFPDALVAGPAAGASGHVLFLVAPTELPSATEAFIQANAGAVDSLVAIGGSGAVAADTLDAAADAAILDTYEILDVSPTTTDTNAPSSDITDDTGARTYTVSGLEPGTTYQIALLEPSVISSQEGTTRISAFSVTDDASTAIESVQGSALFPAGSGNETVEASGDADEDGLLTFVVDAAAPDQAIPIVFLDLDEDGSLDMFEDIPDEPFGLGGLTNWEE